MKTMKGLNEKVAVLVKDGDIPTFKEVALNTVANHRPKQNENNPPVERLKVTKLGLILLTTKDELELEDDYFEVFKKILNNSTGYSEFILGQWVEKFNKAEAEPGKPTKA